MKHMFVSILVILGTKQMERCLIWSILDPSMYILFHSIYNSISQGSIPGLGWFLSFSLVCHFVNVDVADNNS